MKPLLQKILIGCLVLILTMSIVGCAEDDTSPEYAESFRNFSGFAQLEPVMNRYYTGLQRTVEKTDPSDLNTYVIDKDTESAKNELYKYIMEYDIDNADKKDLRCFSELFSIFQYVEGRRVGIETNMYAYTSGSSFLKSDYTPEELVESMRECVAVAYEALKTGDLSKIK